MAISILIFCKLLGHLLSPVVRGLGKLHRLRLVAAQMRLVGSEAFK